MTWSRKRIERKLVQCPCGCGETFFDRNKWGHKKTYASPACGHRVVNRPSLSDLFESKVVRQDGCWGWNGCLSNGYGAIGHSGKSLGAHRVSYELFVGPVPKGMHVCHKCDNPICTNPDHLFLGDQAENMRDMARKGRNVGGIRYPADRIQQVLSYEGSGLTSRKISSETGISRSHVIRILRRETRRRDVSVV